MYERGKKAASDAIPSPDKKYIEEQSKETLEIINSITKKLFSAQINNTNYIYALPFQRIEDIENGSGRVV